MNNLPNITIAVDAEGGDYGPEVIVPACLQITRDFPNVHILAVGDKDVLKKSLNNATANISIVHATETISMDEPFIMALRKRNSSMRLALELVKNKEAQACVSAGNTGALMAIARYVLKTLPGIDRPAISSPLPTTNNGVVHVLDLGANVECSAEHLLQFAIMGSSLVSATQAQEYPSVALLNIGAEVIKGTDAVRLAFDMLTKHKDINFVGFVEGDDIYNGQVDVIVCDGFVGNVALKTSEGLANFMLNTLKQEFSINLYRKIVQFLAVPVLKSLIKKFDPNKYNGASLLGLQGIVIKSHGKAKKDAFVMAIKTAIQEALEDVPGRISQAVSDKLVAVDNTTV